MKRVLAFLLFLFPAAAFAQTEHLGAVAFSTSCAASQTAALNRGIALLHDFWYEEALSQFDQIAKADPACSIAYWGKAMSEFHQIWNRPDEATSARAWSYLKSAPQAKTAREGEYISALSEFFRPSQQDFQVRIQAYSSAMAKLYAHYPDDVDAGAFDALALLAAASPTDTTLKNNRDALAILNPLFAKNPDHPGLVHYIIHACDTPSLAPQGLKAAEHYGEIASSAPHAVHMPGHIFARLGMWQEDIDSNVLSVKASEAAEAHHQSGAFDQFHADDFLLYAYLQSGQDANAKSVVEKTAALMNRFQAMPHLATHGMDSMFGEYRAEFPTIYSLEMRDWKSASALHPVAGALPQAQTLTYWARAIAAGHLHQPQLARESLAKFESLMDEVRKGKHAYMADSTFAQIEHGEMLAWKSFAEGKEEEALKQMRAAADLQDKVGQGEVDIPAREMLADMLLEFRHPRQALAEYAVALRMSPNRLNGLYHAGLAAEQAGDKAQAAHYYAALMKATHNGSASARTEFAHVKEFVSTGQVASSFAH